MDFEQFKSLVSSNAEWFQGIHHETTAQLSQYEKLLGFSIPYSLKWLLSNYGYSAACGIDNLTESVQKTVSLRESINLPGNILLLNDWGDCGLVFCINDDSAYTEYKIFWSNSFEINANTDSYINYPAWVEERLQLEKDEA